MNNPTANSLFAYDLLGEVSIPMVSYDDNVRELRISAPIDKVFFPAKINLDTDFPRWAPDITPGVSAFSVRLMNGSQVVTSFIGIVRNVLTYKLSIDAEEHDGEKWVYIVCTIDRVETYVRNPNVPDVPIILKDVIVHDGFAALIFAGSYQECVRHARSHRIFTHCDKVYHAYDAMTLRRQHVADVPALTVATVILASESEIPNETARKQFDSLMDDYITRVYQCESTK